MSNIKMNPINKTAKWNNENRTQNEQSKQNNTNVHGKQDLLLSIIDITMEIERRWNELIKGEQLAKNKRNIKLP